jgi:hypothetical protein
MIPWWVARVDPEKERVDRNLGFFALRPAG